MKSAMGLGYATKRVAAFLLIALSAACGGASTATSTGSKQSYTLTMDSDLSSNFAATGIALSNSIASYIASVNDSGGVNGHHINFVITDNRSDVPTALANYQKILASDSLADLENLNSAVVNAVGAKATADGIMENSPSGYNGGVGTFPYVYQDQPTLAQYNDLMANLSASLIGNPKGAKAVWIAYDSALQEGEQSRIAKSLTDKGFTMGYNQLVPQTAVDFSVAAGNIVAASPAIVTASILDAQKVQLVSALRSRNYTGPIVNFDSNLTTATMKRLNDPKMYSVLFTADPTDTTNKDVATMLKAAEKYGRTQGDTNAYFIDGWMVGKVVIAALARCGDKCTRQSFNAGLEKTSVSGGSLMAGNPGFSPTNHVMAQKLIVEQWDTTKGVLVPIKGYGF
jgi:ABC-type branched-subunit amino acid transport system substrate-binding protein